MLRDRIVLALAVIALTPAALAQFYDIFQALQPIVHSYTSYTETAPYEVPTTGRPKPSNRPRSNHQRGTTERSPAVEGYGRKTRKPAVDKQTSSRYTAREVAANGKDGLRGSVPSRVNYNDAITFPEEKRRNDENRLPAYPGRDGSSRPDKPNRHTTPRAGVRPASVDERRPPNTNRPPTRRPAHETKKTTQPTPAQLPKDSSPELISGPDEDSMSDVERRRYIEISERMCDKYKSLDTKQLQAIPLLPSPEPVLVNVTACAPHQVPLVVGGVLVSVKEFPHMALVGWPKLRSSGYAWRCGGSLVSSQYILTAAHCAYEERDNSIVMGAPRVVQLGSSYLDDPGALVMRVSAVVRHPKYKQPKSYYDIALIKMSSTVSFSSVIRPACLGNPPPPNQPIVATGWGKTEFGGEQSLELRGVAVQVWDYRECADALGTSRKLPEGPSPDSQICAGDRQGGKDTCQGDSGGPAQIQDGCQWRVVAVTSLGRSCGAANTPALYATVKIPFVAAVVFSESSGGGGGGGGRGQQTGDGKRNGGGRLTTDRRRPIVGTSANTNTNSNTNGNSNGYQPSYNYNQNSGDYSNNYDMYNNQPYYNEPPTWF